MVWIKKCSAGSGYSEIGKEINPPSESEKRKFVQQRSSAQGDSNESSSYQEILLQAGICGLVEKVDSSRESAEHIGTY